MKQVSAWLAIGMVAFGVSACGGSKPAEPAAPATTAAPAAPAEDAADAGGEAEAGSVLDFELVNATGYDIKELYISPSNVANWEENMIPAGQILKNATSVNISFKGYKSDVELWDLKAIEDNGDPHEYKGLNFTEITKLTLNAEDASVE